MSAGVTSTVSPSYRPQWSGVIVYWYTLTTTRYHQKGGFTNHPFKSDTFSSTALIVSKVRIFRSFCKLWTFRWCDKLSETLQEMKGLDMGMDHPEYVQSSIESLGSLLPSVSKQALHRKDSTDVCEREVRFGEQFFLACHGELSGFLYYIQCNNNFQRLSCLFIIICFLHQIYRKKDTQDDTYGFKTLLHGTDGTLKGRPRSWCQ